MPRCGLNASSTSSKPSEDAAQQNLKAIQRQYHRSPGAGSRWYLYQWHFAVKPKSGDINDPKVVVTVNGSDATYITNYFCKADDVP